jgi:hypothetical protein
MALPNQPLVSVLPGPPECGRGPPRSPPAPTTADGRLAASPAQRPHHPPVSAGVLLREGHRRRIHGIFAVLNPDKLTHVLV